MVQFNDEVELPLQKKKKTHPKDLKCKCSACCCSWVRSLSSNLTWSWHPTLSLLLLWTLVHSTIVRMSNINILVFGPLLQREQKEGPTVQEMMDSRKPFSIQRLQLRKIMMLNGAWTKDRTLSLAAFQRKDCSLAGVLSIQHSYTMMIIHCSTQAGQRKISHLAACRELGTVNEIVFIKQKKNDLGAFKD